MNAISHGNRGQQDRQHIRGMADGNTEEGHKSDGPQHTNQHNPKRKQHSPQVTKA